jgi:hypothetical protein
VTGGNVDEEAGEATWTPVERALLDAALEFYDAADGVIDFTGRDRPQLRQDAAGFEAVRRAMAALEACVVSAHAEGAALARIAEIARLEQDMVALILQRQGAAPGPSES